jgi:hypothetical protein
MTFAHDDAFLDNVAALALGVLPASEATTLAKHVAACADCRMLYGALRSTADLVGFQEEALGERFDEVSRFRLKTRVMKSIRSESIEPVMPALNGLSRAPAPRLQPIQRTWLAWAIAAAAIVIAAVDTISNTALRDQNDRLATLANQQSNIAAVASEQARELDRRVAQMVMPGGKRYPVAGGVIIAADGHLVIALRNLPTLPKGKAYQAWTRKRGSTKMTPGATFSPDASGIAFVDVPVSVHDISAVAVSVEPASGSKAPTTKPNFIRTLG